MQTDYFQIELLSPVHIGTGEALDPMSYIMRLEDGAPACYVVDTLAWAGEVEDPEALSTLFCGDKVPAMRRHMAAELDPELYALRRLTVPNKRIYQEYEDKLGDQQTDHQLLFSPLTTTADRLPLIPGSSLKGSIRTAVIDWLDREKGLNLEAARARDTYGQAYNQRLESVLGRISENAFQQLKIADVGGRADTTLLVEPLELRRKEGKSATPKNKCEVMPSHLLGETQASRQHLRISLGDPKNPHDHGLTLPGGERWEWPALAELVNAYYRRRFAAEKAKFYGLPNFSLARDAHARLESLLDTAPGQMILRVGHYSQVEFVTVTNNKPFTRRGKQGTYLPYGTTRTLADGRYPFGWVRLTPCSAAEYETGITQLREANHETLVWRQTRRERVLAEREKQLAERHRREAKAQKAAEAEKERQEALAALPEGERQIVLLEQGALNDNQAEAVYHGIDELAPELQRRAAAALKALWQHQGRWALEKKKKKKSKQTAKVAKLKQILMEE